MTQSRYLSTMLNACSRQHYPHWDSIKPHAEGEFLSLLQILDSLSVKRHKNEVSIEQARIHIDIHKNTMRTRLMNLPQLSMVEAEHIINTGIDSIRKDIYTQMDWVII